MVTSKINKTEILTGNSRCVMNTARELLYVYIHVFTTTQL